MIGTLEFTGRTILFHARQFIAEIIAIVLSVTLLHARYATTVSTPKFGFRTISHDTIDMLVTVVITIRFVIALPPARYTFPASTPEVRGLTCVATDR